MANEIPISVVDRKIKVGRHVPATMTNIGKDYLSISLDNEWSSTNHRLRVTLYSEAPYVSVQDWWDGKSAIEIPQEITSCHTFKVTVALLSEDGNERLVTQAMDEPIENPRNGHDEGSEPGVRTMDIIARIDALAADLEEKRDTDYWRGEPGKDGAPGEPGADGYSPTASVTKVGGTATITVTDKNGTTTATVSDGAPGSDATATEVRINGTSITVDGAADIPIASSEVAGVVKTSTAYATLMNNDVIQIVPAGLAIIDGRTPGGGGVPGYRPIVPNTIDYAVKAAMCDGKGAAWTSDEQKAARERMNAADANKVYIMQKQIENLQGIAATEETDTAEAYSKTVPTGAQKWASLDSVGGKTVVWNQLYGTNYATTENSISGAGTRNVVITGSRTNNVSYVRYSIVYPLVKGHKYLRRVWVKAPSYVTSASIVFASASLTNAEDVVKFTFEDDNEKLYEDIAQFDNPSGYTMPGYVHINIPSGNEREDYLHVGDTFTIHDLQLFDLTQMFGAGNEPATVEEFRAMFPADYYPYNPGELMSAEVVEVESRGKNLLNPEARVNYPQVIRFYDNRAPMPVGKFKLEKGITYTLSHSGEPAQGLYVRDQTSVKPTNVFIVYNRNSITFTPERDIEDASFEVYYSVKHDTQSIEVQLERGTTATPYSPYGIKGTFPIPDDVRNLCPGYGWSAGTVCNEIDFERKVYVQRVESLIIGEQSRIGSNSGLWPSHSLYLYPNAMNAARHPGMNNNVSVAYQFTNRYLNNSGAFVFFTPVEYNNVSEVIDELSDVKVYYELATPIEVDLSDVLPDDHFIEVEAGGTVTFKQASTQLPVPSSVTYQISTSEVIANA